MFVYIMAPARRDGAGWGRQGPGAPPPPASPISDPASAYVYVFQAHITHISTDICCMYVPNIRTHMHADMHMI